MKPATELLHQLKSAAQNATPGEWRRTSTRFNGITNSPLSLGGEEQVLASASEKRDAIFISLASPENILALIEIALPLLEQQEKGERAPNHAQCCAEAGGDISICDCVNKGWVYLTPPQTTTPQIDNDAWIEWGGGLQPVSDSVRVDVKFRNGTQSLGKRAGKWVWDGCDRMFDIIAYRVIENDGREG